MGAVTFPQGTQIGGVRQRNTYPNVTQLSPTRPSTGAPIGDPTGTQAGEPGEATHGSQPAEAQSRVGNEPRVDEQMEETHPTIT